MNYRCCRGRQLRVNINCALGALLLLSQCDASLASSPPTDGFQFSARAMVGRFAIDDVAQLVEWIGPDAVESPWPQIDSDKRTILMLRTVPRGMSIIRKACQQGASNITALTLYGVGIGNADVAFLADNFPELRTLILRSASTLSEDELVDLSENERKLLAASSLSGNTLKRLAAFRHLQVLEINGYAMPDDGLAFLAELKQLENLRLRNMKLQDENLAHLCDLPRLKKLSLVNCPITAAGLGNLQGAKVLTELQLDGVVGENDLIPSVRLDPFPRLSRLQVLNCKMTDKGLTELKLMLPFTDVAHFEPDLTTLRQSDRDTAQELRQYRAAVLFLREFGLVNLKAGSSPIKDITVVTNDAVMNHDLILFHVALINDVEAVYLPKLNVTVNGLKQLRAMANLKTLYCKGSNISDDGLREIGMVKSLRKIELSDTKVTDAGIKYLTTLENLSVIHLDHSQVGDLGVSNLARLSKLEKVSLVGCPVTDEGVRHLLESKSLLGYDLNETDVSTELIGKLEKAVLARIEAADKSRQ